MPVLVRVVKNNYGYYNMKQNKAHFRARNAGRKQGGTHTVNVNTVMDSNGPCGKIKGTAFQIMEKYLAAAKDASVADRVLYENCMQHAEYFFRTHAAAVAAAEAERRENVCNDVCEIPVAEIFGETAGKNAVQESTEIIETANIFAENDSFESKTGAEKKSRKSVLCKPVAEAEEDKNSASDTETAAQDNVIPLDLSFPDVSKLGMPDNETAIEEKADEEQPKLTLKRRGRKPKAATLADTAESGSEDADNHLVFKVETVAPVRRVRTGKIQSL